MKNWKTTLIGLGVAIGNAVLSGGFVKPEGGVDWKSILVSVGFLGLGAVAKDSNVTGGTVAQ